MAEKKSKYEKITTPAGIAKFPRLNKPETHVNNQELETPRYKVTLILDEKDKGVPEFREKIQKLHDAAITSIEEARKADPKKKGKKLVIIDTIKEHLDDDGNPVEGKFEISAKTAAVDDKGQKRVMALFDAKGNPSKANVGGGSRLKLSVSVNPEGFDTNLGAGLSLYLNAVQILDLKEFGTGNANSYGFGEEEGYEVADEGVGGNADETVPEDAATGDDQAEAPTDSTPRKKGDF